MVVCIWPLHTVQQRHTETRQGPLRARNQPYGAVLRRLREAHALGRAALLTDQKAELLKELIQAARGSEESR